MVTSQPRAVYTSANSKPIYPLPIMAIHLGSHSSLTASSLVKTVLLSKVIPGGTKGEEPVARTVFSQVKILSIPLLSLTPTF